MPQAPSPRLCKRSHNHGPAHRLTLLPRAKRAMVMPPACGVLGRAATNKAEYSSPQGKKAHSAQIHQAPNRGRRSGI